MRQFAARYGENESPISGKTRILEGGSPQTHKRTEDTFSQTDPAPRRKFSSRVAAPAGALPPRSNEITHLPVIGSRGQKTTNLRSLGVPEGASGAVFGALWRLCNPAQRHFTKDSRSQPRQRTPKNAFQDQEKCFLDAMENIWGPSGHFGGTWWKSKISRLTRFWARLGVPGVPEWASGAVFGDLWRF